jgi:hypothetical protein
MVDHERHSAAQPQPKRSAGLAARSRCEWNDGLSKSTRARTGGAAAAGARRLRKVCASWQNFSAEVGPVFQAQSCGGHRGGGSLCPPILCASTVPAKPHPVILSAAEPPPKRSEGLPTRSRCEEKTGLASPQALERAEPLRLGTAAVGRLRKVCVARQNFAG